MSKRLFATLASTILLSSAANAEGLMTSGSSALYWDGFYFGAQAGASNLAGTLRSLSFCNGSGMCISDFSAVQTAIGAFAGFSVQMDNLVLGAEADVNVKFGAAGSLLQGFSSYQGDWMTTSPWDASLRARAGILVTPQLQLYVTGGVTAASFTLSNANCPNCAEWGSGNLHGGTRFGWVAGLGAEFALDESTHIRGQYLHADYGSFNATGSGMGYTYSSALRTDAVTLGISHKVN